MATAGSIDMPDGELVFDQSNVRTQYDRPHRSQVFNGTLQVKRTPDGHVVSWRPQEDAVKYQTVHKNGVTTDADAIEMTDNAAGDEVHITRRAHSFWFELNEMCSYYLHSKKDAYELTIMLRDGTRLPTMVFDIGKQQLFLTTMADKVRTRVSTKDKGLHLVVQDDIDALQKSFNSLDLFQLDTTSQTLVGRLVKDSLPTFADSLAKMTHFFTQGPQRHPSRQISDGMLELNPASYGEFEDTFTIDEDQEPGFDFIEQVPELPPPITVTRRTPLKMEEWTTFFDIDGRIADPNNLRARIFRGGCAPEIRSEAWKFLLGVHDFSKTIREREIEHARLTEDYYRMKLQWKSISADQESRFNGFSVRKNLVEKDVNRTDRSVDIFVKDGNEYLSMLSDVLMTYIMYDFDLGYVQGMSDLLSPILSVMQNEPDSFWCFAKFLSLIRCNFIDHDRMEEKDQRQLGIKRQLQQLHQLLSVVLPSFAVYLDNHDSGNLYFCFRWLLIWFKREFSFEDTKRLWEVLWSNLPCENFHLLFCVAILEEEHVRITENNFGLNEILKHINDMCYKIALENNLIRAEQLYFQLLNVPKAAKILGFNELAEDSV
ncbi:TBC1 domain family member 15 isoform 2 [Tropilaelaps mercedesae]|uniref:TBC1 domain family member 15 n=1 Tax=Tropilaelaps mercedesae TaxID=418985 RepID=A0A1V9Y3P4_9ACAR|nr:TBC1 domain family member 15 isoform 2 [Tropilaelaps mercedesae]